MSLNTAYTIESYLKILSNNFRTITFTSNITDYERLDTLSNLLVTTSIIDKILPTELLYVDTLNINFDNNINTTIIEPNNSLDVININIEDNTSDLKILLIHHFGLHLYKLILSKNDDNINRQIMVLSEKLVTIFLNKPSDILETYASIYTERETLLKFLCKPNQLFARAFKTTILDSNTINFTYGGSDFTSQEIITIKDDILELFSSYKAACLNTINTTTIETQLDDSDKINILSNEERVASKNININRQYLELVLDYLERIHNLDKEKVKSQETDIILNSDNNSTDFSNSVDDLNIQDTYSLQERLQEEIIKLRALTSDYEHEIKIIEGEIVLGKKKPNDAALEENLRFLRFLSEEYQNKIRLSKSLDNSKNAYSMDYIQYAEEKDKHKKIKKEILDAAKKKDKKQVSKSFNLNEIKSTISRMFGISVSKLEERLSTIESSLAPRRYRYNTSFKIDLRQDSKKKSLNIYNTNTLLENIVSRQIDIKSIKPRVNRYSPKLDNLVDSSRTSSRNTEANNIIEKLLKEAEIASLEKSNKTIHSVDEEFTK